jgi:hypothetical protein
MNCTEYEAANNNAPANENRGRLQSREADYRIASSLTPVSAQESTIYVTLLSICTLYSQLTASRTALVSDISVVDDTRACAQQRALNLPQGFPFLLELSSTFLSLHLISSCTNCQTDCLPTCTHPNPASAQQCVSSPGPCLLPLIVQPQLLKTARPDTRSTNLQRTFKTLGSSVLLDLCRRLFDIYDISPRLARPSIHRPASDIRCQPDIIRPVVPRHDCSFIIQTIATSGDLDRINIFVLVDRLSPSPLFLDPIPFILLPSSSYLRLSLVRKHVHLQQDQGRKEGRS